MGSTIKTVGHFDNSLGNRYNPSPDEEVYRGEQSWDEMFLIFTKYTVDKDVLSLENQESVAKPRVASRPARLNAAHARYQETS